MTAASCKKNCVQNILMWLSGRAVKTQLQIVLIRLLAVMDGYQISVKVVVYPSYNDIHDIFLSEISSQRSRH